jgi:hypothetical protein
MEAASKMSPQQLAEMQRMAANMTPQQMEAAQRMAGMAGMPMPSPEDMRRQAAQFGGPAAPAAVTDTTVRPSPSSQPQAAPELMRCQARTHA